MFRLLSRQAFKAVPRPSLRLSASRHVHSIPVPYTGPPSYDAIARRFSSRINPQAYFTHKRQQDARDRGEFIDIHDVGGVNPADYDVLITDITHEKLQNEIAEELGIQYLSKAAETDAKIVVRVGTGYIHGLKRRVIIPFVVSHGGEARWVFFIVDSGSPLTQWKSWASMDFSNQFPSRLVD